MSSPGRRESFTPRRGLLLVEVARRCRGCDAPARLGLTKDEALLYDGFGCENCELWNADDLTERDVPEWWGELRSSGLDVRQDDGADALAGDADSGRDLRPDDSRDETRGEAGRGVASSSSEEPYVLPQWAIQIVRAALFKIFRLFFGLRLSGVENIPREGGLIIAANHQTYLDPFWVGSPVKRPLRFLAWDRVLGWFAIGPLMRWLGAWPLQVQRADARAYRRSVQWLRSGGALVIFPEGRRGEADGALQPFKHGTARLALEAGVPVLPVTIRGGERVWSRERRAPRPGRVEIVYHPARRLAPLPGEDTRACARRESEQLYEIIKSAL
ncbi:MAG TPA: lysophospholipid acyltransferase family protein [Pyrinomonadaceae bacterium]|jgi:1-acyl-sn-glycerol-3-phosphate acyltransferase|nr:lysophospholipid acyltransferase family protein [Pyrinomonadaceae bacterium]